MSAGEIYRIIRIKTGKCYVGQTTRTAAERFEDHKHCKTSYIGRAIRKHGVENFTVEVLEVCETREQLNERERFWIAFFNCKVPNGYNLTDGGETGFKLAEEAKAKISNAKRGVPISPAHCKKLSEKKMGEKNPNYGHPLSPEHRLHISVAQPNSRAVICVESQIIYHSLAEAARCVKISIAQISLACRIHYRTARGFHWRFLDEVDDTKKIELPPVKRAVGQHHGVICVETGMAFDSGKEAATYYNIDPSHISRACRIGWLAGGFHWRFQDEQPSEPQPSAITPAGTRTPKRPVVCVETNEVFE